MKTNQEYKNLSYQILDLSYNESSRNNFLNILTEKILLFTQCDEIQLLFYKKDKFINAEKSADTLQLSDLKTYRLIKIDENRIIPSKNNKNIYDLINDQVLVKQFDRKDDNYINSDSCIINNIDLWVDNEFIIRKAVDNNIALKTKINCKSLAVIPVFIPEQIIGVIQLRFKNENGFDKDETDKIESLADNVAISILNFEAQSDLRERVKELYCIYQINQISTQIDISIDEIMTAIVKLLPPAWQYPEISDARITIDGNIYDTSYYKFYHHRQVSDIVVNDIVRGTIEVVYKEQKPEFDEDAFLKEERNLIDAIARQISLIIEKKEREGDRQRLQEQLQHADRLALLGKLAAGVAHELNEPLGSILGFAQLAEKSINQPEQASKDIEKIIKASLYSREIIKKLMSFARENPKSSDVVNLNNVVLEGLLFFESRCAKANIELIKDLADNIPDIKGDHYQFNQVLLNLVVNSIQAMPNGGNLIIRTINKDDYISLIIEDTGIGMTEETRNKIFMPFFTTKDVDEGTGLGLPVVHGIIKSYHGKIKVDSLPGKGTIFEILLPIK